MSEEDQKKEALVNQQDKNEQQPQDSSKNPIPAAENPSKSENTQKKKEYTTLQCWLIMILTYIFGFGIGVLVLVFSPEDEISPLTIAFYTDCISTMVVFIFSLIFQNTSLYDPYWGFYPIILITYWQMVSPYESSAKNWACWGATLFYSLRHGYLYFRFWHGLSYEDYRYLEFKEKFKSKAAYWAFSCLSFHYFPTFEVFAGLLPFYYIVNTDEVQVPAIYYIGLAISVIAVIIEAVADEQLYPYRTKIKDKYIDVGLWRYSRHPNYFGEIAFWWGLYIAALGADAQENWWTGVGALSINALFYFYSIPSMEKRTLSRRKGYRTQMKRVNKLILWCRKEVKEEEVEEVAGNGKSNGDVKKDNTENKV